PADGTIDVYGPATEEVIARIPEGSAADVDAAVRAARRAFDGWANSPVSQRAEYLQKIHEGLKARAGEIAETISREVGMPLKLSQRIQAGSPIAVFGYYAKLVTEFPFEERV